MAYKILINYNTGDSLHNEDGLEGYVDGSWENKEVAKRNLVRIQEHYTFLLALSSSSWEKKKSALTLAEARKKDWFSEEFYNVALNLELDNGKLYQTTGCWIGYFESLNFAEIEEEKEEGLRIEF